jgi:hypothetical protein
MTACYPNKNPLTPFEKGGNGEINSLATFEKGGWERRLKRDAVISGIPPCSKGDKGGLGSLGIAFKSQFRQGESDGGEMTACYPNKNPLAPFEKGGWERRLKRDAVISGIPPCSKGDKGGFRGFS